MSPRTILLAVFLGCGPSTTAPAVARETIVGIWQLKGQSCRPALGTIAVKPLAVVFDEYACNFTSVSRVGDVVHWQGTCAAVEGPAKTSSVTAGLEGNTLSLFIDGDDNGRYVRCR